MQIPCLRCFEDPDEGRFAVTKEEGDETVCSGSLLHDGEWMSFSIYLGDPFDAGWLARQEKTIARGKEAQLP